MNVNIWVFAWVKKTLTVYIPTYTNYRWMCLLLCFFVHFWGTKPQRFPEQLLLILLTHTIHEWYIYLHVP